MTEVRNIVDSDVVGKLGKVNNGKYYPKTMSDTVATRQTNTTSTFYETKYHFLETNEAFAQDPHIDYQWNNIDECNNKIVKPVIGFVPLSKDGMMINVWFPDHYGEHVIKSEGRYGKTLFFPYKLQVPEGKIAFLNGDVIHGGGLLPSGRRCHIYLSDTRTMGSRKKFILP